MKYILMSALMCQLAMADSRLTMKDGSQVLVPGSMIKLEVLDEIPPPPTSESPDKTLIPPALTIVDSAKSVWTLVSGVVMLNNMPAGYSANVSVLLYFGKNIYQQNSAGGWWMWTGSDWADSSDPRSPVTPPPGTKPPVVPPLAGATKGNWQEGSLGGMTYAYMMPYGYDGTKSYPVMLFLHQLQNDGAIPAQIDPWFNTPDFRARHPAIVIAPRCTNSSADRNWGGVSAASQGCGDLALGILKDFLAKYPVQTNRVYVTGDSMGGIGSWDMIIRFPDMFAATFILAGATYDHDLNSSAALLKTFPIWAIHGQNDTQVPLDWERNIKPLVSNMQYEVWNGYGHDVWDDAYPQAKFMDWMFAQARGGVPPPPPSGGFHIVNGQIIDPQGKVFVARGINMAVEQMTKPVLATFPGINFIRMAVSGNSFPGPSTFASFIQQMTAAKVVVEIENHVWPSPLSFTGAQLQAEANWYASLAAAYKSNPYVWFGSINEPGDSSTYPAQGPAISAQHKSTYDAVRGTGSNTVVMFDYFGGGNPGSVGVNGGATPTTYAAMSNIVWDYHFYGWIVPQRSSDQATVDAAIRGSIASASGIIAAQSIKSKDGLVPAIVGEFGDSTDGMNVDGNASQVIQAVINCGCSGFAAWHWFAGGNFDQLTTNNGNGPLSAYGKTIAAAILVKSQAAQPMTMMLAKKAVPKVLKKKGTAR